MVRKKRGDEEPVIRIKASRQPTTLNSEIISLMAYSIRSSVSSLSKNKNCN